MFPNACAIWNLHSGLLHAILHCVTPWIKICATCMGRNVQRHLIKTTHSISVCVLPQAHIDGEVRGSTVTQLLEDPNGEPACSSPVSNPAGTTATNPGVCQSQHWPAGSSVVSILCPFSLSLCLSILLSVLNWNYVLFSCCLCWCFPVNIFPKWHRTLPSILQVGLHMTESF